MHFGSTPNVFHVQRDTESYLFQNNTPKQVPRARSSSLHTSPYGVDDVEAAGEACLSGGGQECAVWLHLLCTCSPLWASPGTGDLTLGQATPLVCSGWVKYFRDLILMETLIEILRRVTEK